MNPELPQVNRTPEVRPQNLSGNEYGIENASLSPEVGAELEQANSSVVEQYNNIPVALPVVDVAVPSVSQDDGAQKTATVVSDDDTPLVAADEDLIEKEWVDKLKKIIILTKDDPYERSRVITQLQIDYLKKRYNKTLGQDDNNK
jgi:hypothetical protein cdiviTM7_01500